MSEKFKLEGTKVLTPTGSVGAASCGQSELLKSESMRIQFDPFGPDAHAIESKPWLFVVEAFDQINGRHQLQIIRTPGPDDIANVQFKMVHSIGETFGERVVSATRRLVEIVQGVKSELMKLRR